MAQAKPPRKKECCKSLYLDTLTPYQSLDKDGHFLFINKAWLETLGYKEKEVLGKKFSKFISKEYLKEFKKCLDSLKKSTRKQNFEFKLIKKDGETLFVEFEGKSKMDNKGKLKNINCVFKDITEKKKAEKEIKLAKENLDKAQQIAHTGSWYLDLTTNELTWSDEIYRIFGLKPKKFGATYEAFIEAIHPDDRELVNKAYKTSVKKKIPYDIEHRIVHPNGEVRFVREICETAYDKAGKPLSSTGSVQDITESKINISQTKESEEKYRLIYETSTDAIMTIEPPSWRFTSGNSAIVKMFGVKDEKEFATLGPWEVSPRYQPDGQLSSVKAKKMIAKAMKEGSNFFEWTHKKVKGADFYATVLLNRVNFRGKSFLQARVQDISESQKAKDELSENEEKLRTMMTNVDGMFYRGYADWSTEYISESKNLCGYAKEDLNSGKINWLKIIHQDDKDRIFKEGAELTKKSKNIIQEYRIINKKGEIKWVSDHKKSTFDKEGKFKGVDGVVFDITEKKNDENKLMRAFSTLNESQELAQMGSWEFYPLTKEILWSGGFSKVLGYENGELKRDLKVLQSHIFEEDREGVIKEFNECIHHDKELNYEFRMAKKDGEIIDVRTVAKNYYDSKGRTMLQLGFIRDITKEKQLNKTKNEFISFVSHQLKGPVSNMNFGIEFLLLQSIGDLNEEQEKYLRELYAKNKDMVELINLFLNVSKIEMGQIEIKPENISVNNSVKKIIDESIPKVNEKKINITATLDKKLGKNKLDKNLLEIIIRNLISNAIKYSKSGGKINIKTHKNNTHFSILVKDNGIGIAKADQEKVFDRMFRASNGKNEKTEGSGLGLYITKKIVDGMGGKISLRSEQNKGSTFKVDIPFKGIEIDEIRKSLTK